MDLNLGKGSIVRDGAELYGRSISVGREAFIDKFAVIGGGSADCGTFTAGDWLHMGMFSQVNTARDVVVGDEVGIGIGTRIFTHGAYLPETEGFPVSFAPVTIGSRVWLPNALVMPGVTIGDDVVVAAGSVVTSDLPSGCLAGGTPTKVIRENAYPSKVDRQEVLERICEEVDIGKVDAPVITCGDTAFNVALRTIFGPADEDTERLRNQLRRHGIRFRYEAVDGEYRRWSA